MDEQLSPPLWIDTTTAVTNLAEKLEHNSRIAIDTESNSLHAYQEQVCLIQFSIPGTDFLVDPLKIKDLKALAQIFSSPATEKIFHASEYDIICLKRDHHFEFANIFDTMIAARVLGVREIGLNSLLQQEFGVELDKKYQKANWAKRPLPAEYLSYARMDTHYLIQLRDVLADRLVKANLLTLAEEEFQRMTRVEPSAPEPIEKELWRVKGARDLNHRQLAILLELLRWREDTARRLNRPPFKIISSDQLVQIAQTDPLGADALKDRLRLSKFQMDRYAAEILRAVTAGKNASPVRHPQIERMDHAMRGRVDRLKTFRKNAAAKMQVESDIILPREVLYDLALSPPQDWEAFLQRMALYPWRLEHFGREIFHAIQT